MFDFTLPAEDRDLQILKDNLSSICKRWVFQREVGKTGYDHYQGRFSLREKKSIASLITFFKCGDYPEWTKANFSLTSKEVANTKNFNYVMKDESRVGGPWKDTDEEKFYTKQMQMFDEWGLLPWQESLKAKVEEFDLRTINLIYDKSGCLGKSLFSEHMEFVGLAEEVPPYRLMDDIFQWVCTRETKKCYIFDMPRGMKKDKLADFYAGIEVIKNGVAYDKRHRATKIRFNRPRVFVFTNTLPVFDLMSKDRWNIWNIDEKKELVKFNLWDGEYSDED